MEKSIILNVNDIEIGLVPPLYNNLYLMEFHRSYHKNSFCPKYKTYIKMNLFTWLRFGQNFAFLMSLVSHQKSYFVCDELSNFGILSNIFCFQAAVSALLAVSVLYIENKCFVIFKISYFEIQYFVKLANRQMRNQGHNKLEKVLKKNPFFHKSIQTYQKYYTRKSELKIIKTRDCFCNV